MKQEIGCSQPDCSGDDNGASPRMLVLTASLCPLTHAGRLAHRAPLRSAFPCRPTHGRRNALTTS